jgi:predicted nucleic acid-binding protein
MHYLDSSALAKLVVKEPESDALRNLLDVTPLVSSALVETEVVRVVLRRDPVKLAATMGLLARVALISLNREILHYAGRLGPPRLRSLDAIHLASALTIRDELEVFIAYDRRLLEAATALGLPVASPGML